jgi:predicted dehydrogenase
METVSVGVLGFAHGHVPMYCNRWRAHPEMGVRLAAGWDHDAERRHQGCGGQGIEEAASAEAILARPGLDAVVIGAETSLHADLVELAASAGKAVILQKPIALSMEQADRIVAAVERSGVPFTLAWQMRVDPHNLEMKSLLASGRFGKVFMVRRRHGLPTHLWKDFDKAWHVQPEFNRDIFADDACHPIDFLYWLLGEPRSVTAEIASLLNPAIPNDNAIAVFRFAGGVLGEICCSFAAVAGENTTEIVCENGVIIGNYGDLPSCLSPRPAGGIQLKWYLQDRGQWSVSSLPDITQQGERIAGLAGPLAEFLRGRRPAIATAEEGRTVLRMVLACYESAQEGRRIHF